MKYVLEFDAQTDKAAIRAADCAREASDALQITRLTNVSYPDSVGRVLIDTSQITEESLVHLTDEVFDRFCTAAELHGYVDRKDLVKGLNAIGIKTDEGS